MRERVARAVCVGMVLLTDTHTHTLLYTHCSPARTSRERGVSERGCREERDREKEERERGRGRRVWCDVRERGRDHDRKNGRETDKQR